MVLGAEILLCGKRALTWCSCIGTWGIAALTSCLFAFVSRVLIVTYLVENCKGIFDFQIISTDQGKERPGTRFPAKFMLYFLIHAVQLAVS